MMKLRGVLSLLAWLALVLPFAGCAGSESIKAERGKEFTMAIGQTASIKGEDLSITFLDVTGDSRCPKNVECPRAGDVSCRLEITYKGVTDNVTLIELGLTGQNSQKGYKDYYIEFHVTPYPEAGKPIEKSDYRLLMTVNKVGILEGEVNIGPLTPVEKPGETPTIPPEVYALRKIMVYDESRTTLIKQVDIGNDGYYRIELKPGTYTIEINHVGIDRSADVPRQIEIEAGKTVSLDIDIDTGIR
jgi:hypothetical protein